MNPLLSDMADAGTTPAPDATDPDDDDAVCDAPGVLLRQGRGYATLPPFLAEARGPASKLCHLSLSANKLTSLSTLRSLPHLQVLDVSRNALESLDGIAQLSNLRVLQAHENRIGKRERCTLPLQELDFLEELWLGSNEIEAPSELLCLEHAYDTTERWNSDRIHNRRVRIGRLPVLCCVLISSTEVVRRESRHRRGPRHGGRLLQ